MRYNKKDGFRLTLLIVFIPLFMVTGLYAQTAGQEMDLQSSGDAEYEQQDPSAPEQTDTIQFAFSENSQINFTGLLAKALGYFLLIVLLIVLTVYLLKRFVYNRKGFAGQGKVIKVVSSTYVGPKKSLMLVEAAGRMLVISVTDSNMNLITELNKEEYEQFEKGDRGNKAVSNEAGSQFGDILNKFLKRAKL